LPANYTVGRRRIRNRKPQEACPEEEPKNVKHTPKTNIRTRARRVELTLLDDTFQPTESQVFLSLYKAAKFLGTVGCNIIQYEGRWCRSKIDDKLYRVAIFDPLLT
jgi:hypothetical protein